MISLVDQCVATRESSASGKRKRAVRVALGYALFQLAAAITDGNEVGRPLTVTDLFRLESLGSESSAAYDQSGERLALVVCRSHLVSPGGATFQEPELQRGDIWIRPEPKGELRKLTDGEKDDSGWCRPRWSPDGRSLAFLSTRGGMISLWVWTAENSRPRQLSRRPLEAKFTASFEWVDNSTLIFLTQYTRGDENAGNAVRGWSDAVKGLVPTANVVVSGVESSATLSDNQLVAVDLNGNETPLLSGKIHSWTISPDRGSIAAILIQKEYAPAAGGSGLLHSLLGDSTIRVMRIAGDKPPVSSTGIQSVVRGLGKWPESTICWSRDSRALWFFGFSSRIDASPDLFRMEASDGRMKTIDLQGLGPAELGTTLYCTASDELLLISGKRFAGREDSKYDNSPIGSGWLFSRDGAFVFDHAVTPPADGRSMIPYPGGRFFVGAPYGSSYSKLGIWRWDSERKEVNFLTKSLEGARIVWPTDWPRGTDARPISGRTYSRVVLDSSTASGKGYSVLDLDSGTRSVLPLVGSNASLLAFSPDREEAILVENDQTGLRIWEATPSSSPRLLLERNQHLKGIEPVEWRALDYVHENGQTLRAWIALPVDYRPGRRYPCVVSIYPGDLADRFKSHAISSFDNYRSNPGLLTSQGYAVLFPSIPMDGAEGPMFKATRGILPAVQKAVGDGLIDDSKVFLTGISFGGFGTVATLTQSTVFKAAVAECPGMLDLTSNLFGFHGNLRFTDAVAGHTRSITDVKIQGEMRSWPWEDPQRFVLNSPVYFADKITTPLMLIHGDYDSVVPIEQSEEMFRALQVQNKRVEFVRYWGEGHGLTSPANIQDRHYRVLAWYDEFGDIARDDKGNLLWDGDRVKSRDGAPALKPEDFQRFDAQLLAEWAKKHPQQ